MYMYNAMCHMFWGYFPHSAQTPGEYMLSGGMYACLNLHCVGLQRQPWSLHTGEMRVMPHVSHCLVMKLIRRGTKEEQWRYTANIFKSVYKYKQTLYYLELELNTGLQAGGQWFK